MALQKDYYSAKLDMTKTNCYWKISNYNGINGGKNELRCNLVCYANKDIADTNRNDITDFNFEFIPDLGSDVNFIAQAYAHLKTLDEFSSAVDV